jgi:epoxyqueuosine reductase
MSTRDTLSTPKNEAPVLMHSCCAPCAAELMEALLESKIEYSIFFYNPNIHPKKEYELRKQENIKFAQKHNIEFIDADYDTDNWFDRVKGLEFEPERGERCTKCFDMRFERTALYAKEHGFPVITSSLGISRWKSMEQINGCGLKAASRYEDMSYWTYNWRKKGGGARMYEISKRENFYKQEYCGCIYSLRDTNLWRKKTGRKTIHFGKEFYTEPDGNNNSSSGSK